MCVIVPTIIGRSSAYSGGLQIKESQAQFRVIVLCSWADTLFRTYKPVLVNLTLGSNT